MQLIPPVMISLMSRFSYRDELLRNAEAVGRFYEGVVGSWTEKLLREYKYKQALPEDTILHLQKVTPKLARSCVPN